jgi:hypothetical protein
MIYSRECLRGMNRVEVRIKYEKLILIILLNFNYQKLDRDEVLANEWIFFFYDFSIEFFVRNLWLICYRFYRKRSLRKAV